jgi:hypothetical protein
LKANEKARRKAEEQLSMYEAEEQARSASHHLLLVDSMLVSENHQQLLSPTWSPPTKRIEKSRRVIKTPVIPRATLLSDLTTNDGFDDLSDEQFDQLLEQLENPHLEEDYSDVELYEEDILENALLLVSITSRRLTQWHHGFRGSSLCKTVS